MMMMMLTLTQGQRDVANKNKVVEDAKARRCSSQTGEVIAATYKGCYLWQGCYCQCPVS